MNKPVCNILTAFIVIIPVVLCHAGRQILTEHHDVGLEGDHLGAHQAGKDLTEEIDLAPHGPENVDRVKLVGVLQ